MKAFELSPGNTLAYRHRPPRDSAGITFVYFNALSGDKSMWESGIVPDLEASGHGMLAFNYRGIPLGKRDGDYLLLKCGSTADWNLPLEDIRVPVLNITGLQDHVFFNADDVDALLGRLPNAERVDMPDAGHLIPAEKPTELAGVLEAFAGRCRSTAR